MILLRLKKYLCFCFFDFICNNPTWAIILNSCGNSVNDHRVEKNKIRIKEIDQEIQAIHDEVHEEAKKTKMPHDTVEGADLAMEIGKKVKSYQNITIL